MREQTDSEGADQSVEARRLRGRKDVEDLPDAKLESTSDNEQLLQG